MDKENLALEALEKLYTGRLFRLGGDQWTVGASNKPVTQPRWKWID